MLTIYSPSDNKSEFSASANAFSASSAETVVSSCASKAAFAFARF
jgi:hypothetical protein